MRATQNHRPPVRSPAFEVTETAVIIRPWETTLTLPVPQGRMGWENPVPHTLMGIECFVSRVRRRNVTTGFGLFFPQTATVISIDVLAGMGVNLIDIYVTKYRDDAAQGLAHFPILPRYVCDDTVLLALMQAAVSDDAA